MRISSIYTDQVGPLVDSEISFENDWTEEVETKVLLTGPNGCGKSTLIRGCAMLWTALGYWLDQRKALPQKHEAKQWLQRWGGMALIFDGLEDITGTPDIRVGLMFGSMSWCEKVQAKTPGVFWLGEAVERSGRPGQPKRSLYLPKEPGLMNGRKSVKNSFCHRKSLRLPT